jgi:S1-C subfamily serine protease
MAEDKRQEQEFSFIKEKIKRQHFYQNRTFRKVVFYVVLAAVCGVIACFVFVRVYPWMEKHFGTEEKTEITIPREDEEETDTSDQAQAQQEPIVIQETQELEVEDYKKLYTKLREVAAECAKSMVTVTAASSDTDWFNETYVSSEQYSGLLVGNNGVELLILTGYSQVKPADRLQVTFTDKSSCDAVLKNYDAVTDLAVISVNLADMQESTLDSIQMANLGSSRSLRAGDPVIAVGSPAGIAGSVLYGNLVSAGNTVSVVDGEYQLLITDMNRSAGSSGVLIDLDGRVIGLIENAYTNANNQDALTAYAISDMKNIIEHLSNSQDIVYLGITGADVTEEISDSEGIPSGVYITEVATDSPAMNAGIQRGDIITEISGQTIETMDDIQEILLKLSKDQVIQIRVMRQGREEYKEIPCSVALTRLQ